MSGELAGYQWVNNARNGGSAYAGQSYYPYKPVILLHMTVSMGISASYISGHSVPPHLWANPYNKDKFQTVPLDRAAYALYQPQFGYHWVNKHDYMLQTELVGMPVVNQETYTDEQLRWIAAEVVVPQVRWLRSQGLDVDLNQVRYHNNSSGSASEYWYGRFSEQEMADFNGLCAHIDAWGNDHWDCSVERLDRIAMYARAALGESQIKPKEKILTYLSNRAEYVAIGVDGNVYHKTYDTRAPAWIPDGPAWNALGSPNSAGGCRSLSVFNHEDWLTVVVVGKNNEIFQKAHHPTYGWLDWQLLQGLNADEVATVVRFTVTSS